MCQEDSGEILSDDTTHISDRPGQSRNDSSHQDTNTTQLMEESETVAEEPDELVIPQVSHGVNWTAVDVYKIFHQFNRSTTAGKERDVISLHNVSAPQTDLNQTLVAIKRTNITTNITGDREETGDREKRSAGSAHYHQPLHISREDDISVLSVAGGADTGLQYHSM